MKRLVLLATAAVLLAPAGVHAAVPCRDKIYNQWYSSGKISTNYPIACYHDALAHVPGDAHVYSNLDSDIQAALQAALTGGGKGGPVGHGLSSDPSTTSETKAAVKTQHDPNASSAPADPATSSNGVPTPILVLGALALLLIASGAAGLGVKQYRKRSTA